MRLFRWFLDKSLVVRELSRCLAKIAVSDCIFGLVKLQRRHFCTPTEALLGFNGASVAMQNGLKQTLKVPLLKVNKR